MVESRNTMIKGHLDLSFLTDEMLTSIVFHEKNHVANANGMWDRLGILQPSYLNDSAVVYQSFDSLCPDWAHRIKDMFPQLMHKLVTVNCLTPGSVIPPHVDKLYRLKTMATEQNLDITGFTPIRINVLLQDKKIGHFLDIDNVSLASYSRGDYVYIFPDVTHSVANIGYENRYTLQVSGFILSSDLT